MRRVSSQWSAGSKKLVGFTLCAMVFVLCQSVQAQQPKKIFRIGVLDSSTAFGMSVLLDAFRQELNKLGWIEGKNLTLEYRFAEQKTERLPELAAELVRLNVDLIIVTGANGAIAAKNATATIPIVMTSAADPVGAGLVASLARPGGNVTGFTALSVELNTKRLEMLKSAVPKLDRVGLLLSRGGAAPALSRGGTLQQNELRTAALAMRLTLEEIETQVDVGGLENAFQTAKRKQVQAIMTTANRQFFAERKRIVELATKNRFPAIYFQKEFVDEGGLMSYGTDYDDLFRRSAQYADKILKGAQPAVLPVQQATKFEFVINLKAAKQIGLTIPGRVLERANKVMK
jgi:putative ABC transport system substrate-binding protein